MKKIVFLPVAALVLASCSMMGPSSTDYTLARPTVVKSTLPAYAPAGTVKVGQVPGVTRTTATLTGLAPFGLYVAHYHMLGKDSDKPCDSGGGVIDGTKAVGQADKDGKLTLDSYAATGLLKDASYYNIHSASDFNGTPSDSGVICTPVTIAQ